MFTLCRGLQSSSPRQVSICVKLDEKLYLSPLSIYAVPRTEKLQMGFTVQSTFLCSVDPANIQFHQSDNLIAH